MVSAEVNRITEVLIVGAFFIDTYSPSRGYSDDKNKKLECLNAYVNGAGFRAIERLSRSSG